MSQGVIGFNVDGTTKYSNSNTESASAWVGRQIVFDFVKYGIDVLKDLAKAVVVIDNPDAGQQATINAQGSSAHSILSSGLILNATGLFNSHPACEYAFVIDFDANAFKVYELGNLVTTLSLPNLQQEWNTWVTRP